MNKLKNPSKQRINKDPLKKIWYQIKYKNYNYSNGVFKLRNENSVYVIKRWLLSFEDFLKDIGNRPTPKHVLCRIDKLKGYTPDNCKWMTHSEKGFTTKYSNELTIQNLSKLVGLEIETIRGITYRALKNQQNELNGLLDRIIYTKQNKRYIFKPEAIEYFKQGKYFNYVHPDRIKIEKYYLRGIDEKSVAKEMNVPISKVKSYYRRFESKAFNYKGALKDPESIVGHRIGRMLILKNLGLIEKGTYYDKRIGKNKLLKERFYLCKCKVCGQEKKVGLTNISLAGCKICGRKNPNSKINHPLNQIWDSMVYVNYRKLNGTWKLRDNNRIPVCDRWLLNFFDFVKDVGDRPSPKHGIGRIDSKKGYTPENCKWMIRKEKSHNRKDYLALTMTNLSKQIGISKERVRQITDYALMNKENELNKLIERVDFINANKRVFYKPEAIEYFKERKYERKKSTRILRTLVKQQYSQGKDMETVAKLLNKPIESIKRYYKMFDKEKNGTN